MSQRITYVDKSTLNPSAVPENNKWSGENGQELKEVINSHADDIEALEAVGALVLSEHIQLTQAQIQALNTTPIELVSAPGAGKYIEVDRASAFLDHNGTTYGVAGSLTLEINSIIQIETAGLFINAPADKVRLLEDTASITDIEPNSALNISADADATNNGGTIDVFVNYTIRDTN